MSEPNVSAVRDGRETYRYWRDNSHQDYMEFRSHLEPEDGSELAEAAAEDFHDKHDGWESQWPIRFTVATSDGTIIGQFLVEREAIPNFVTIESSKGDSAP